MIKMTSNFSQRQLLCLVVTLIFFCCVRDVFAVPEVLSARITDVTPSSFSMVWMTDVEAVPGVEIYKDRSMTIDITDKITIVPMHGADETTVAAARQKGVLRIRVSGLEAQTVYYVRAVTIDFSNPQNVGYSPLMEVKTATRVESHVDGENGVQRGLSNDLLTFAVYIRQGSGVSVAKGDVLVFEVDGALYPLSAFVGSGVGVPEAVLDLNNLFTESAISLNVSGFEIARLRVYRGGTESMLLHYRKMPANSGTVNVLSPIKGFFADINLDGNIDDLDFEAFKEHYRTISADGTYNPDFDFSADSNGKVDVRDFSLFAPEYGKSGVE